MTNIKEKFFDEGFIYPLKAFEAEEANSIKKNYISFG